MPETEQRLGVVAKDLVGIGFGPQTLNLGEGLLVGP